MPHIHKLIDFVVTVYIVHKDKVLLVDHKKLKRWLPIGGHIELDEDPEQALFREIKEECGLKVDIYGKKPSIPSKRIEFLHTPIFLDIHQIAPKTNHKHIGLVYFARSKSDKVILNHKEHNAIRWFSRKELEKRGFNLRPSVVFYAKKALGKLAWKTTIKEPRIEPNRF